MLKICFTGYIGADCRTKVVENQVAITFSVGVTKSHKNRQGVEITKTNWIGCTIWRKPEHTRIAEFLKSGKQVYVEGEPSVRPWLNQKDQTPQASFDCRVDFLEMLGRSNNQTAATNAEPVAQVNSEKNAVIEKQGPGDNDDLPF
jgi:single stranded DNA-binding protein